MWARLLGAIGGGLWQYLLMALAVATVGLGAAYWIRGGQLKDARADVKTLEIDLRQAKVTIAGYEDAVKRCNTETNRLKLVSEEKGIAADKALLQAQQEARRYQEANKRRAVLLAAPTPAGAGCSQALATLRAELRK